LGIEWSFPEATHSYDALLYSQWVTGEYWERHGMKMPVVPEKVLSRVRKLEKSPPPALQPWRTVRDAISDLPNPESRAALKVPNHVFQGGARVYPGHTG